MCLNKVTVHYGPKDENKTVLGYKVVERLKDDTGYTIGYAPMYYGKRFQYSIGKTVHEDEGYDIYIDAPHRGRYGAGFHIYTSLKDTRVAAKGLLRQEDCIAIIKVRGSKLTAKGKQGIDVKIRTIRDGQYEYINQEVNCYVCRTMEVLNEISI
jgi:hypothetical protein